MKNVNSLKKVMKNRNMSSKLLSDNVSGRTVRVRMNSFWPKKQW